DLVALSHRRQSGGSGVSDCTAALLPGGGLRPAENAVSRARRFAELRGAGFGRALFDDARLNALGPHSTDILRIPRPVGQHWVRAEAIRLSGPRASILRPARHILELRFRLSRR